MNPIYRNLALGIAIVAIAGLGLYYATSRGAPSSIATDANANATNTIRILPDGTLVVPKGVTVKEVTSAPSVAPDYKAPLKYSANVSPEVRAALDAQLKVHQEAIAKNGYDFNAWVRLGGLRKTAGDYQGAAEVWEYTAVQWPGSEVSFNNLGDLYMNFLKDYTKAEANYQAVIKLDARNVDAYVNLYYLYRDLYKKGTGADKAILEAGLKANPGNQTLLSFKAQS